MSYCGDYFSQADVSQRQSILVKNMQYMRENKRVSVCLYSSLSLVSSFFNSFQMAEEREQFIRDQRRLELQRERELLLKTPINWSYTLKWYGTKKLTTSPTSFYLTDMLINSTKKVSTDQMHWYYIAGVEQQHPWGI